MTLLTFCMHACIDNEWSGPRGAEVRHAVTRNKTMLEPDATAMKVKHR